MKRIVLQDVEDLINGQSILEIAKIFERLHKKYSEEYDTIWLEGFNIVGTKKTSNNLIPK